MTMSKPRRHHNNKGLTQAKRGKLDKQAKRLDRAICRAAGERRKGK